MQITFKNLPSEDHASVALLRLEPVANFRFRPRCFYPFEPVACRRLLLRRDDFHRIAAAQYVFERHQLAVNARAGAVMPDFGMNAIGEIDNGRALRKIQKISLRREHVHRGGEQVFF